MSNIDEFMARVEGLEVRLRGAGPAVAAAMGRAFQERVRAHLLRYQHPMYIRTQAPAGGPPAYMSGELYLSVLMDLRGGETRSVAYVGPHTIYAGVQEFGRTIRVRNKQYMRWYMEGKWYYRKEVEIPERPYMRPTRDEMIADGSLHRVAVETFLAAEGYG